MEEQENKNELKRMDFPSYIGQCLEEFLKDSDPFTDPYYSKLIKDSEEYMYSEKTNRNPRQVPGGTWVRLLDKHTRKYYYN